MRRWLQLRSVTRSTLRSAIDFESRDAVELWTSPIVEPAGALTAIAAAEAAWSKLWTPTIALRSIGSLASALKRNPVAARTRRRETRAREEVVRTSSTRGGVTMARDVSAELVLVDPELARVERARLVEEAAREARTRFVVTAPAPARLDGETPKAASALGWRWAMPAALATSVLANGVLAAFVLGPVDHPSAAARPATLPASPAAAFVPVGRATTVARVGRKARAEQSVLLAILHAPHRRLPLPWIDRRTGLPKNGLHVRCRRSEAMTSFRCVVTLPPGRRRVVVRFNSAPQGGGKLAWSRRTAR
jgi:hypothetical protein